MTQVLNIYLDGTHGSQNAPYAFFILPALRLQKPSGNSKTKDNVNALQGRFEPWCERNVRELIKDSKLPQKRLSKGQSNTSENTLFRNFTIAVTSGNVGLAGKLIDETTNSSLESTSKVINQLKKHPSAEPANTEILIKGTPGSVTESLYAELTGKYIKKVALMSSGGAGPSGLDAKGAKKSCGRRVLDIGATTYMEPWQD